MRNAISISGHSDPRDAIQAGHRSLNLGASAAQAGSLVRSKGGQPVRGPGQTRQPGACAVAA